MLRQSFGPVSDKFTAAYKQCEGGFMKLNTTYTSRDVNYNEEKFITLDKHFTKMIEDKSISGAAYSMSRYGKKFVEKSVGSMSYDIGDSRALKPDAIFSIYSVTNLFTAVAVFKLIEDGEFRLDTPVGDIIEEFKQGPFKDINITHLLSHTSGINPDKGAFENPYYMSPWDYIKQGHENGDDNWIKNGLKCGMRNDTDKEWVYSSFGYNLLGEVISRVSGMFAEDFIEKEILKPCELWDTCFAQKLEKKLVDRIVIMDKKSYDIAKRLHNNIPLENTDLEKRINRIPATGGGLFSTTSDLVKFGNMLLNNGYHGDSRILGRLTISRMTTRYTGSHIKDYCGGAAGTECEYGLGPDIRYNLTSFYTKGSYYHEGKGASCLIMDPKEKMVAAWVVPLLDDKYYGKAIHNTSGIMWSGIL